MSTFWLLKTLEWPHHWGKKCQSLSRVQFFCPHGRYSLPGSSVCGFLQARILEEVALSSSTEVKTEWKCLHVTIHTNFFSSLNVSSPFFQFFRYQLWILSSAMLFCSPKFGFGVLLWASGHLVFPGTQLPAHWLEGDAYLSIIHWTVNSMKTGNLLLVKSLEPRKMLGAWYSLSKYLLNEGNSILGRFYKVR